MIRARNPRRWLALAFAASSSSLLDLSLDSISAISRSVGQSFNVPVMNASCLRGFSIDREPDLRAVRLVHRVLAHDDLFSIIPLVLFVRAHGMLSSRSKIYARNHVSPSFSSPVARRRGPTTCS
ncbi:hypothetical protein FB451DRAFT_1300511 [Mycena latifolia]|nr:hypothetical protein FB451DRAFT_1300511 [Mycena latifolia]